VYTSITITENRISVLIVLVFNCRLHSDCASCLYDVLYKGQPKVCSLENQSRITCCTLLLYFFKSLLIWSSSSVFLCFSWPWHFLSVQASYFGFVWCSLMIRFRLYIFGKNTTERMLCPFERLMSRGIWYLLVLFFCGYLINVISTVFLQCKIVLFLL
jgi:hypothetical protein